MDPVNPKFLRAASAMVLIPIAGMLGGLILGGIRTSMQPATDQIADLHLVLRWGVTGFFLGLALVVLLSLGLGRKDVVSLRRLMVLVAIAGLLTWYFAKILFGVIG